MKLIIIGSNRAEIIDIDSSDQGKHFVQTRGQLYRIYPNGLSRMRILDADANVVDSDEVVVFGENSLVPYHTRGLDYSLDRQLADIDEHKLMLYDTKHKRSTQFWIDGMRKIKHNWAAISAALPLIIAGIVLVWAFLG